MDRAVTIVDPDPGWPARYREVARELRRVTGLPDGAVRHVGSTSVPGCAGKDRIDLLVLVEGHTPHDDIVRDVVEPLGALGFSHEPQLGTFLPERFFLHRDEPVAVNVHVERTGLAGALRDTRLVVRDALRADARLRDRYVELKRSLAEHSADVDTYAEGKSGFLFEVIATAAAAGDRCGVHLRAEHPDSPAAVGLVDDYVAHLTDNVPGGFDCATDSPPPEGSFEPPRGTFLVARDDARPVGCGAMWEMEPGVAEIRRMWVAPTHHGIGLGRRMLDALEAAARAQGCDTARLDSMHSLTAAVAMYRARGYREIDSYNANPNATVWMERSLR